MKTIKKTKIVCTIGPASWNKTTLIKMVSSGMDIARLNMSHGDYPSHQKTIDLIREVEKTVGKPIGIMLDTKGPEIRLNNFEGGTADIKEGDTFTILIEDVLGTKDCFSVNYPAFVDIVKKNQIVKVDDGKFLSKIIDIDIERKAVKCKALNSHVLKDHKGVNIIGARLDMEFISQKDKDDIAFAVKNNLNYVAASFVRRPSDVLEIRELLDSLGGQNVLIISKIESSEAISKIKEIVKVSDALMVARGDLGVELPCWKVPNVQIELINESRNQNKPVIIATQMLESMQYSNLPTRAEVNDVALGIVQGADSVMLSGESASGRYPVESTDMQQKIALEMETKLNYEEMLFKQISNKNNKNSLAKATSLASLESKAKLIIIFDELGKISMDISMDRPYSPVVCVTSNIDVARSLNLYWGVFSYVLTDSEQSLSDNKFQILKKISDLYGLGKNDHVIMIRTKHQTDFGLKEESIRIISLE